MHASTEKLLSLRDGEPVEARIRAHVDGCPDCAAGLQQLITMRHDLRQLDAIAAPEHTWAAVNERLQGRDPRPMRWLAVAAAVGLLALVVWRSVGIDHVGPEQQQSIAKSALPETGSNPQPLSQFDAVNDSSDTELDRLVETSRRLEQVLRVIDNDAPRVMSASAAGTIAGLEDGIAVIDFGLSNAEQLSGPTSRQLWQQRVSLMNTLVQVRGAQLQQVNY